MKLKTARLRKLIRFLKKLPVGKFELSSIRRSVKQKTGCKTIACAVGWTPEVFPDLVTQEDILREYFVTVAVRLFEMDFYDARDLFSSRRQCHIGLPNVGSKTTPKQFAKILEMYITKKTREDK